MTNSDKVQELSKKGFEDFTKKGIVLVDFFADWCMPCITMAPIIDELSEKFKEKIQFANVNVDENQELAQKFSVMSIPNFILFKDGKISDRFVGAMSVEDFSDKLKKHL